jgi:glycerol-3-phosphate acyltransferase PlsY
LSAALIAPVPEVGPVAPPAYAADQLNPVTCAGRASVSVAPVTSLGPALVTVSVYVVGLPGVYVALPSVFVTANVTDAERASVSDALALAPLATLAAASVWIATFLATRYTSVASLLSAATLPLFAVLFGASWPVVAFAAGAAVAIFALHRANIARLVRRTENRFELGRRTT